ncbi:Bug family tripartite tricarboxylate transporter substrate binding protein [Dongia sp.]|uniref:Bug family tripartite tricarboxylate transporter substrate binding protein n=1 Tax=Dongia sp. TaxID=1977262 RepID=UPI0035ADEFEF
MGQIMKGVVAALAMSIVGTIGASAWAQEATYPVDTITIYTHSKPGSGSDLFLRAISRPLSKYLGAKVVVDYWAGGSGAKAMANLATAPADGSTFYATTPTHITTSLLSKPEKTYKDIDYVVNFFYDPEIFYTKSDSPFATIKDAVDFAVANPGKAKWGGASAGSLERQILEKIKKKSGAQAAIIPHEDGAGLLINVLNGTVDLGIGELGELAGQIAGGELKPLGVYMPERLTTLTEVPTARELGVDEEVIIKFRGLAGPKGIPAETIKLVEAAAQKVLADPEFKAEYEALNLIPGYMGQEEYRAYVANFVDAQAKFYADFGVTAE